MIEVKNVTKKFIKNVGKKEKFFSAVDDVSFNVEDGKILGILGQNGAGKTTLLRMISGIMTPTKGSIIVDNLLYEKNAEEIKSSIAFLSGNTKIYNNITTYELLKIFGKIYSMKSDILESRIKEIVTLLNMENFIDNKIGNLSTGQTQRVNIARCFIHDPKYYILDEATTGLDVMSSQIIIDFIKEERKKGKTVIYSTHYMEEAENICDEIIFIDNGKIIDAGKPKQLMKKTRTNNLRDTFFKIIGGNNEN